MSNTYPNTRKGHIIEIEYSDLFPRGEIDLCNKWLTVIFIGVICKGTVDRLGIPVETV